MKRFYALSLSLALAASLLAGCGSSGGASSGSSGSSAGGSGSAAASSSSSGTETPDPAQVRQGYQNALNALMVDHVFPDGTEADVTFVENNDFSDNQFAVCDIDGDGVEELILCYTNASMAGNLLGIYQYDPATDSYHTELSEFPSATFYDNGYVKVDWSHNQGMAGDFWPYSLYQYDAAADEYVMVKSVDAWQKSLFPKGLDGTTFPDDVDTSHSGFVYYLYDGTAEGAADPVDKSALDQLVKDTYGSAQEVNVDYQPLTAENVQAVTA